MVKDYRPTIEAQNARAAELLKDADVLPLFYVKGREIFQRPTRKGNAVSVGFRVCTVADHVNPAEVCAILNKGDPATEG